MLRCFFIFHCTRRTAISRRQRCHRPNVHEGVPPPGTRLSPSVAIRRGARGYPDWTRDRYFMVGVGGHLVSEEDDVQSRRHYQRSCTLPRGFTDGTHRAPRTLRGCRRRVRKSPPLQADPEAQGERVSVFQHDGAKPPPTPVQETSRSRRVYRWCPSRHRGAVHWRLACQVACSDPDGWHLPDGRGIHSRRYRPVYNV